MIRRLVPAAIAAWGLLGATPAPGAVLCSENAPNQLDAFDAEFPHAFGTSIDIHNDIMIVGAPGAPVWGTHSGAAYIYERSGTGWQFRLRLTPDDGLAFDRFGAAVAVSGSYAIVGAPGCDASGTNSGAFYVFQRFGYAWAQVARIDPPEGIGIESLGAVLDLDGRNAIVGIKNAALGYQRSGDEWFINSFLTPDNWPATSEFGAAIKIRGNLAIIGNPGDDPVSQGQARLDAGAAYIHTFNGTAWQRTSKVIAMLPRERAWFGASVDIDDTTAVVGAPRDDVANPSDPKNDAGAVYIYRRSGQMWAPTYLLKPDDASPRDNFGASVALSPHALVVGSPRDDTYDPNNRHDDAGSVYLLRRGDYSSAMFETHILPNAPRPHANFGRAVAADGATAVVGAPFDDSLCPGQYLCQPGSASIVGGLADCNQNNQLDTCDILQGVVTDADHDWIIDGCLPCQADFNADGLINVDDLQMVLSVWGQPVSVGFAGDVDANGIINAADLNGLLSEWMNSCY